MSYLSVGKHTIFRPDAWGTGSTAADAKLLKFADKLAIQMGLQLKTPSTLGTRLDSIIMCWVKYKEFATSEEGKAAKVNSKEVEKHMLDYLTAFRVFVDGIDLPFVLSLPLEKLQYKYLSLT